jgi:hypothetical protein
MNGVVPNDATAGANTGAKTYSVENAAHITPIIYDQVKMNA